MTTDTAGLVVLVLLGAVVVSSAVAWTRAGQPVWAPLSVALLAATLVTAGAVPDLVLEGRGATTLLVVLAGAAAVAGGGPVTAWVFAWVDRHTTAAHGPAATDDPGPLPDPDLHASQPGPHREPAADPESIGAAGAVLRGGAWIGALERAAVFLSVVVAQPEGLAIALALKGLGRYPELRSGRSAGAAERFIIGTFTSVLWAVACAGLVRMPT